MAHVSKQKRGTWPNEYHVVQYTDEFGKRRTVKGFSSLTESRKLGQRLEDDARRRKSGMVDVQADQRAGHAVRPISEHVDEFATYLEAQGITGHERRQKVARLKRLLTETKVTRLADVTEAAVVGGLGVIKAAGKSNRTCMHFWKAAKQFTRWLKRNGRMLVDPLAECMLHGYNPAVDRKRLRRDLTEADGIKLIEYLAKASDKVLVRRKGKVICRSVSPIDRIMFYSVAWGTGFRGKELRSLTPESFHLAGPSPSITLQACDSKHRKEDEQAISAPLAANLAVWLEGRALGEPVFLHFWRGNELLHADLKGAGIPYRDSEGRYADLHAQRHTYIARLAKSVRPEVTQKLARHSDIRLTLQVYGHTNHAEEALAVGQLPQATDMRAARALQMDGGKGRKGSRRVATSADGGEAESLGGTESELTFATQEGECIWRDSNPQPSVPKTDALSN